MSRCKVRILWRCGCGAAGTILGPRSDEGGLWRATFGECGAEIILDTGGLDDALAAQVAAIREAIGGGGAILRARAAGTGGQSRARAVRLAKNRIVEAMTMGRRGPLPQRRALSVLKGTARPDRERHHPQPTPIRPSPPRHLDRVARAKWRELCDEMERLNLLTRLDGATMAAYCAAYAHWAECERVVREQGRTCTTPSGQVKPRPEFTAARQWLQLMLAYGKQLGLSPEARLRMDLPADDEEEEDELFWGARR